MYQQRGWTDKVAQLHEKKQHEPGNTSDNTPVFCIHQYTSFGKKDVNTRSEWERSALQYEKSLPVKFSTRIEVLWAHWDISDCEKLLLMSCR